MEETITIFKKEYDALIRIKELNKEQICVSNKKGQIYQKYVKDKEFLKYLEEFYPLEYKQMRKEFEKRQKIFAEQNLLS